MASRVLRSILLSLALPALGLMIPTHPAGAASLSFVEVGDTVTVQHDANFECGISFSTQGETAHVDACWITNSPPGYSGTATAYMVEPAGDPNAGAISDEIRVQFNVDSSGLAHASIDFISDTDGVAPSYPPPDVPVLVENGQLQGLNGYFFDPASLAPTTIPANLAMYGQSDAAEAVPTQPTTWGTLKALYH